MSSNAEDAAKTRERELIREARAEAQEITAAVASRPALFAPLPDSFPGYKILRERNRGGQGVVYEAAQIATKRRVAIKVMREGPFADSREIARFEREVHILAQLEHANIVSVHDCGEVNGHFYYVMDFVPGKPLDAYLQGGKQTIREILALFSAICDAVNAAHLRGVIHRDLKPDNILIDADGVPHILDFGLAKLAGVELTHGVDPQRMSVSGQFIGSLPWASPEQAEGMPDKIDVRTDVYSLGVILYQILTGRFPYEVSGPPRLVLDNIARAEPIKPAALRRGVDDELQTIILKCLDKEPARRYQTAGDLCREVNRYLAGEPIEAKSDSSWYLLRKQVQRHKVAAAVAAGYMLVITAAAVGLFASYRTTERQRQRAADAGQIATEAVQFLASMGEVRAVASANDPFSPEAPTSYDLEKIKGIARWLETQAFESESEAAMRTTIGLGYLKLRAYDKAETHLARALSLREQGRADPRDVAESLHNLGRALFFNAKYDPAEACYVRAVAIRRQLFGEPSLELADSYNDLGACLMRLGRLAEAEQHRRKALQMRRQLLEEDDPRVVAGVNNLAACLKTRGRYEEALELFQAASDWLSRQRDINQLFVVRNLRSLAGCLTALGRHEEAMEYVERARAMVRTLPGDPELEFARCDYLLAHCRRGLGHLGEAERLCRGALRIQQANHPPRHPAVADSMLLMGAILLEAGEPPEANGWLREALRLREEALPEDHWKIGEAKSLLGACLAALEVHGEGDLLLHEGHDTLKRQLGEEDPRVQEALARMRGRS